MGVLVCSPPSNYLYQYGVTDLYFMIWATILHGLIDFVTHIFPALAIVNIYLCLCPFDIAPRCWVCFLFICCCWDFFLILPYFLELQDVTVLDAAISSRILVLIGEWHFETNIWELGSSIFFKLLVYLGFFL